MILNVYDSKLNVLTYFFFFKQKTAYEMRISDWSSDVCSSDLWIERNGERKQLNTLGRGAVLGEAGFFGQRRTANVQALTSVRLLRFDSQDLERLRIRYPKVAALEIGRAHV